LCPRFKHEKVIAFKLFFRNDEIVTVCPHDIITEDGDIFGSIGSGTNSRGSKKA